MQRRKAIKNTLYGMGALAALPLTSSCNSTKVSTVNPTERALGVQLFTIPQMVHDDLKGTLELLGRIGYREVEFFGPYPFTSEKTKKEWVQLSEMLGFEKMAFFGYTLDETVAILKDNGLTVPSLHADLDTMRTGLEPLVEAANKMGARYLVIPALMNGRDTLEDYERLANEFNLIGEKMSRSGVRLMYHNHGYEHTTKGGKTPMNVLLENTETDYVSFELDVFWMAAAGADPISYLEKYPDKYKALHLKDASKSFRFRGDGGTPDQWMEGFPLMSDPGDGVLDIPGIITAAEKAGVDHYFLERDLAPQPQATLRNAYDNLRAMG